MKTDLKFLRIGLLAGLGIFVLGFLLNFVFMAIFPGHFELYKDASIFIQMGEDARGYLFMIYPFALGIGLARMYTFMREGLREQTTRCKIMKFACVYFVVAALPAFFINAGSFPLPIMMIVSWTIMSYLNGLLAGFVFVKYLD